VILLGPDVLIDVALDRRPHAEASGDLLTFLQQRRRMAYVAWHTLSNFYYLVSPTRGREDARQFLTELTRFVLVAPADLKAFREAALFAVPDFEDALQVAAARACGASYIVTRNVEGFVKSPVPTRTPAEILVEIE